MNSKLNVSLSPHVHSGSTVTKVMWMVNLALLPALAVSVWAFGIRVLAINAVSIVVAVLTEYLITRFMFRKTSTIGDGAAVLTGLLLAFNVPAGIPLWEVAVGSLFAMSIGKMIFGGLGHNPFNPALVGRAFMLASFPGQMASWPAAGQGVLTWDVAAVTAATPLANLAEGGTEGLPGLMEMFLGSIGGSIGEISALAILAGGLFLLWKKIITWEIPVLFLGTLFVFTGIFWLVDPALYANPVFHIFAGGAMLGAWFMATDMVTSPMTFKGRAIYAVAAGLLTGIIRLFGAYPEGVSYAILIMNALVPIIDTYVRPKRFGTGKAAAPFVPQTKPEGGA